MNQDPRTLASVDYEELRARVRARPVGGIPEIGNLITCPRLEDECPAVTKFRDEFPFQHEQHMTSIAPMISQIARRIFDNPHAQIADFNTSPRGSTRLTRVDGRRHARPVGYSEWDNR
jgi:hypothetical protein